MGNKLPCEFMPQDKRKPTISDSQVTSLLHIHRSLSLFSHDLILTPPQIHHISHSQLAMASPEVCIPCGQQFNDWKDYIRHLITSGNHPHACATCAQEFQSEEGKQSHQRQVCISPNSSITILTALGPSTRPRTHMQRMPQGLHALWKPGSTH